MRSTSRALRMAELAERMGLSPRAATRLVDRLEEHVWVRRESPRQDRRTIDVLITTDGRRAYVRNNRPFTAAAEEAVTARMSDMVARHRLDPDRLFERIRECRGDVGRGIALRTST